MIMVMILYWPVLSITISDMSILATLLSSYLRRDLIYMNICQHSGVTILWNSLIGQTLFLFLFGIMYGNFFLCIHSLWPVGSFLPFLISLLYFISFLYQKWSVSEPGNMSAEIQRFLLVALQRSSCESDPYHERLYIYEKDQSVMPSSFSAIGTLFLLQEP